MSPVELAALESAEVILGLNNPFVPARDTAITGAPSLLFLSWTDHLESQMQSGIERSKKGITWLSRLPGLVAPGMCYRILRENCGGIGIFFFCNCYRRFCRRYKRTIVIDSKQFQHEAHNGEEGIIVGGKK